MRSILFATISAAAILIPSAVQAQTFSGSTTSFPATFTFNGSVYQGTTDGLLGGPAGWGPNNTVNLTVLPLNTHVYDKPPVDTRYTFYRQPYSVVIGNMKQTTGGNYYYIRDIVGHITPTSGVPTSGTVTYTGRTVWHDLDLAASNREGDFSYTINFSGTPTGSGSISNLRGGSGFLAWTGSGTLASHAIQYDAADGTWGVKGGTGTFSISNPIVAAGYGLSSATPTYDLALFGPNAQEVAGVIKINAQVGSLGIAGKQ
ncbi:factor H binding protein domain-containing protein [Sphingobium cloacae]|uniref:Factor H binding protein-like C-terminal domain-containing protein n=1 Tax=Sphingobium cloacae TaxID=120107 RepID=A0A1E1F4D2_9SPHN|nr:factor H binding protein domain-containing protein [Sphingobium cloacae]BAV65357.1 hypothetical protein SCLO_1023170 [Sphingobium cloacae]